MKIIASLLVLVVLAACKAETLEPAGPTDSGDAAVEKDAGTEPAEEPKEGPDAEGTPAMGVPNFAGQEGWVEEQTTSNMRHAQFRLPKVEGDETDTEVVVFWFQGGGGDVESNFSRWSSQFAGPDGGPVVSRISDMEVKGRRIDLIELAGSYAGSMGQGGGPGMAMVGAIVESEKGPYFCRLLGPEKSVAKWKPSYMQFLNSVY